MFLQLLRGSTSVAQIHQLHAQILVHGISLQNHLLAKLVDLNSVDYARSVFDRIHSPSDFSWNSLIKGYIQDAIPQNSLILFLEMLRSGIRPSNFTYPFLLNACSALASIREGEQIHAHAFRMGFGSDRFVNNSLINMYCKCCFLSCAFNVLDEMPQRDEVSWNSIIGGYVQWGEVEKARSLFEEMPLRRNVICWTAMINGYGRKGDLVEMFSLFLEMLLSAEEVKPNSATMVCLLSACSTLSNFELGRWLSVFIDVNAIPLNAILCTALIDMHSKCGNMDKAQKLFNANSCKNLASWNAIMTGYVQCGLLEKAICLFYTMQATLLRPNEITMVNVLSACAGLGALELGREVHRYLVRNGLEVNVWLATALIDMYSKCGKIDDACLVFIKTCQKDVALWNAMILGLAYHGIGKDSLAVFAQMERVGVQPNEVTFIGILSACNHSGLVVEGRIQFSNMVNKYGLNPKVEHYACMVDLLGRAGHLEEAFELIQNMVVLPDSIIWGTLLSACRIHRNLELADKVGQIITSFAEPNLGFCILLSNIYASVGRWKDVDRVRRLVKEKGIKKPSGCSWIEVAGAVHRFVVEDALHVKSDEIYEANKILVYHLKDEGYVPNVDFVLKKI
ncbi:pentatricopeptide repeat-containing protein At1g08070, chloroplastic-like [Malania oleifera]|uniref:pentatricopeptide repeat-containing protein At1g08070, chloroplastic-like n=1 Tax=Malania oleifera TaxID=397392 RepID=UPI0025AE5D6D|nr:pentatricopeptide repeat-containing protein At1g08070, chloroplastic-like [Malania oleifera]